MLTFHAVRTKTASHMAHGMRTDAASYNITKGAKITKRKHFSEMKILKR
jgi:hypothetical protein